MTFSSGNMTPYYVNNDFSLNGDQNFFARSNVSQTASIFQSTMSTLQQDAGSQVVLNNYAQSAVAQRLPVVGDMLINGDQGDNYIESLLEDVLQKQPESNLVNQPLTSAIEEGGCAISVDDGSLARSHGARIDSVLTDQVNRGQAGERPLPSNPKTRKRRKTGHPPVSTNADLLASWHPDNDKKPEEVGLGSKYKAKWQCLKGLGHPDWEAFVYNRKKGTGCPECFQSQKRGTLPFVSTNSDLLASWHSDNDKKPEEVTLGSMYQAKWRCLKDLGHPDWEARVAARNKGSGCPECSNSLKPDALSLVSTNPDLLASWHADNDKKPEEVTLGSGYKAKWRCLKDLGHPDWEARVQSRNNGSGCPECAPGALSFVSTNPDLLASWHADNDKKPEEVTLGSKYQATWRCLKDLGHPDWEAKVQSRNKGSGCPECATGALPLVSTNFELSRSWHRDNDRKPEEVTLGSKYKAKWQCLNDSSHPDWLARVSDRKRGRGCLKCALNKRSKKS